MFFIDRYYTVLFGILFAEHSLQVSLYDVKQDSEKTRNKVNGFENYETFLKFR